MFAHRLRRWANIVSALRRPLLFFGSSWSSVGLLLVHRLRRWTNFKPALGDCLAFVWFYLLHNILPKTYKVLDTTYWVACWCRLHRWTTHSRGGTIIFKKGCPLRNWFIGPTLNQQWVNVGPTVGQRWTNSGSTLDQQWVNVWRVWPFFTSYLLTRWLIRIDWGL